MSESYVYTQLMITLITSAVFFIVGYIVKRLIKRYARSAELSEHRTNLIAKYINFFIMIFYIIIIIAIWGLQAELIFTYISGALTVIGVAFFAQWSILSNITSGIILFFSFPFRIGDVIKVHDKDFPIEGQIEDIKAFHTLIKTRDGEVITYPNNLLLQKGVSIVPIRQEDKEFYD
ncbi:mechanosensitive ion channel domain-containing protein [Flavobacterium sp. AG291]|uniref:mechanosensitive ion channel domain-containing protein n=1 Tax=Flavobacterium sp. AG291 TaxID=2184000 RepID=UPI000E0CA0FC|nr:mechanosensitive ion channel domain-containing protein [Flavobacterium sp. AG291]RDI14359.1 mechanosensitive ion channel-like protein [Flavobacterium sp. AG291]